MEYRCPKCGSNERLQVKAMLWLDLIYERDEFAGTVEDRHTDHEWEDESPMFCRKCDFLGTVVAFEKADARVEEDG